MVDPESIPPMNWIIYAAAVFIVVASIFNKTIKALLKIAIIVVVLMFVVYFLVQDGVINLPTPGN